MYKILVQKYESMWLRVEADKEPLPGVFCQQDNVAFYARRSGISSQRPYQIVSNWALKASNESFDTPD